ncbi:MAG TPA: PorV/PorQ family protein [Longimicrobiales bacterium]|nr:PorV/PorQ family protein [Longimicrobiales bacterium]
MRFLTATIVIAVLLGGSAPALRAQEQGSSTEAALFLLLPVGAKGVGMARAMTALEGSESVWWNPAGLAGLENSRIQVTRGEDISGDATSLTGLYHRPGVGTFGASYLLLDLGEVTLTDREGNPLGRVSFRYHTGLVSGATRVLGDLALGMNLKVIQSRLTCRGECLDAGVTATTYALDAGAQWRDVAGLPLTLGAALVHAGPRLQVVNEAQSDPLPTRMRVAVAYDLLRHWEPAEELHAHARLAVELEDRWRDPGSPAVYVATELAALEDPAISLRAGYVFGAELQVDGAGVGIGIRFEQFDLGISKSLASSTLSGDTDPVNITFGYIFR